MQSLNPFPIVFEYYKIASKTSFWLPFDEDPLQTMRFTNKDYTNLCFRKAPHIGFLKKKFFETIYESNQNGLKLIRNLYNNECKSQDRKEHFYLNLRDELELTILNTQSRSAINVMLDYGKLCGRAKALLDHLEKLHSTDKANHSNKRHLVTSMAPSQLAELVDVFWLCKIIPGVKKKVIINFFLDHFRLNTEMDQVNLEAAIMECRKRKASKTLFLELLTVTYQNNLAELEAKKARERKLKKN